MNQAVISLKISFLCKHDSREFT
jgi:hypothetical protein